MNTPQSDHIPQEEAFDWYDEHAHGLMDRRTFMGKLGGLAALGFSMSVLTSVLLPNYALAEPEPEPDPIPNPDIKEFIDAKEHGAFPNTGKDMTDAIDRAQKASAREGLPFVLDSGVYLVDGTKHHLWTGMRHDYAISWESGASLVMQDDTIIRVIPNNANSSAVFHHYNVEGVKVVGGTIEGEKFGNTFAGAKEWGHGLSFRGTCRDILYQNVTIKNFMGDCISLSTDNMDANIRFVECNVLSARRHEVTHSKGGGIKFYKSFLGKESFALDGINNVTYGGLNVDIEPDGNVTLGNLWFDQCEMLSTVNASIRADLYFNRMGGLKLTNNTINTYNSGAEIVHNDAFEASGNTLKCLKSNPDSGIRGFLLNGCAGSNVKNNIVDGFGAGIVTSAKRKISGVQQVSKDNLLEGNTVKNSRHFNFAITESSNTTARANTEHPTVSKYYGSILIDKSTGTKLIHNMRPDDVPASEYRSRYVSTEGGIDGLEIIGGNAHEHYPQIVQAHPNNKNISINDEPSGDEGMDFALNNTWPKV